MMGSLRVGRVAVFLLIVCLTSPAMAAGQTVMQTVPAPPTLAPYVPTPYDVVERMLKLAGVTKRDLVYDLGCGDGRIGSWPPRSSGRARWASTSTPPRSPNRRSNAKRAGVEHLVDVPAPGCHDRQPLARHRCDVVPAVLVEREAATDR